MEALVRPLFPRYLFCRLRPGDAWHESVRAAGVGGIAVNRGLPVPVSDDLVAVLRGQEIGGAIPDSIPANRLFRVGQAIEVKESSFKGLRGKIDKRSGNLPSPHQATDICVICQPGGANG